MASVENAHWVIAGQTASFKIVLSHAAANTGVTLDWVAAAPGGQYTYGQFTIPAKVTSWIETVQTSASAVPPQDWSTDSLTISNPPASSPPLFSAVIANATGVGFVVAQNLKPTIPYMSPVFVGPDRTKSATNDMNEIWYVKATDPNNDTLTYKITSGDPNGLFNINAKTGEITLKSEWTKGESPLYLLTIQVTDSGGPLGLQPHLSTTGQVQISFRTVSVGVDGETVAVRGSSTYQIRLHFVRYVTGTIPTASLPPLTVQFTVDPSSSLMNQAARDFDAASIAFLTNGVVTIPAGCVDFTQVLTSAAVQTPPVTVSDSGDITIKPTQDYTPVISPTPDPVAPSSSVLYSNGSELLQVVSGLTLFAGNQGGKDQGIIGPYDVKQGYLGDCNLLSILALLAYNSPVYFSNRIQQVSG